MISTLYQTYSRHKTFKNVPILSGTTFDIGVPFTYNLPNSTASLVYTGRKMEDEHSAVFEMAEDLLNKWVITVVIRYSKLSIKRPVLLNDLVWIFPKRLY